MPNPATVLILASELLFAPSVCLPQAWEGNVSGVPVTVQGSPDPSRASVTIFDVYLWYYVEPVTSMKCSGATIPLVCTDDGSDYLVRTENQMYYLKFHYSNSTYSCMADSADSPLVCRVDESGEYTLRVISGHASTGGVQDRFAASTRSRWGGETPHLLIRG